ncbi:MAG: hypothetical protein LBB09_02145 [Rickettsiales bacterium]|jgi:hypothetical protein|nr:hypothetical protein [Rickettsiales bacterium]
MARKRVGRCGGEAGRIKTEKIFGGCPYIKKDIKENIPIFYRESQME